MQRNENNQVTEFHASVIQGLRCGDKMLVMTGINQVVAHLNSLANEMTSPAMADSLRDYIAVLDTLADTVMRDEGELNKYVVKYVTLQNKICDDVLIPWLATVGNEPKA